MASLHTDQLHFFILKTLKWFNLTQVYHIRITTSESQVWRKLARLNLRHLAGWAPDCCSKSGRQAICRHHSEIRCKEPLVVMTSVRQQRSVWDLASFCGSKHSSRILATQRKKATSDSQLTKQGWRGNGRAHSSGLHEDIYKHSLHSTSHLEAFPTHQMAVILFFLPQRCSLEVIEVCVQDLDCIITHHIDKVNASKSGSKLANHLPPVNWQQGVELTLIMA